MQIQKVVDNLTKGRNEKTNEGLGFFITFGQSREKGSQPPAKPGRLSPFAPFDCPLFFLSAIMKLPWMKFYPADWIADLGHHDIEIEGAWIRICAHIQRRGTLGSIEMPLSEWCRLLGRDEDKCEDLLHYVTLSNLGIVTDCNGIIKVTCRRLEREAGQQVAGYNRVKKFRMKRKCNTKVTPVETDRSKKLEVRSKKLDLEVKKEIKELKDKEPDSKTSGVLKSIILAPEQQVIEYYKFIKGFDKIKNWDKVYFSRFCRDAQNILKIIPYCPSALKSIERVGEYFNKKELDWNLSTVVGYLPEYLSEQGGKK